MRLIILCCGMLLCSSFSGPGLDKKQFFLDISDHYSPNNRTLLEEYPTKSIEALAPDEALEKLIFEYPTIVHEAYHTHNFRKNIEHFESNGRIYFINDSLSFLIDKFSSFECREINKIAPQAIREKVFRYELYINSPQEMNHDTQQNGLFGLLEEYCAYYQDYKTYVELFVLIHENYGYNDTDIWVNYLSKGGSVIYAMNEFKLFMSWYLQTAREYHPEVYQKMTQDMQLKRLNSFLENENDRLTQKYLNNVKKIEEGLGESAKISAKYIQVIGQGILYGLHHESLFYLQERLNEPQQAILNELRFAVVE